jgi:hypothetical protein
MRQALPAVKAELKQTRGFGNCVANIAPRFLFQRETDKARGINRVSGSRGAKKRATRRRL